MTIGRRSRDARGSAGRRRRADLMNRAFRPTVAAMSMSKTPLLVAASAAFSMAGFGCATTPQHAEMVSNASNVPAAPLVDRDKCSERDHHVVTSDLNGDKKPDVWKFFKTVDVGGQKTEVLSCKQVDLNHDGKVDMVTYYDDTGSQIVLEEIDGDFDGKFDFTAYYNQGKRVRDEFDMNFDSRVDLWKYYEDGKLVRIEKDTNNDGKVDEWEYYEGGKLDRIGYDTTGSGRVDKWDRAPETEEEGTVPGTAPAGGTAPAAGGTAPAGGATAPAPASGGPQTISAPEKPGTAK